jgi:hypothetical protein
MVPKSIGAAKCAQVTYQHDWWVCLHHPKPVFAWERTVAEGFDNEVAFGDSSFVVDPMCQICSVFDCWQTGLAFSV